MTGPSPERKIEETARMLTLVIGGTGLLFILFAVFCLTNVPLASDFIDIDEETLKLVSYALLVAGVIDLIVAKFFIKKMLKGQK
jgi:hypothetical protein